MSSEFPPTLDLSGADLKGFDPVKAGTYDATVVAVEAIEAENPDGRLPMGTPGINVQFKIDGGPYDNRRVFNRYWMPPLEYDEERRKKTLGMLARFLMAIGYPEEQVTGGGFNLDLPDMVDRDCKVTVKVDHEYNNNKVTNVKPRDAGAPSQGGLL
jgi:hypothetical protein